jgi:hypothetical protein
MSKKYVVLLIPLIALFVIGMLSGDVYSLGHFKGQSGIGGTIYDCNKCHNFVTGIYGGGDPYGTPTPPPLPPSGFNLRWVKTTFEFCSLSTNIACDVNSDCPEGETCVAGPTVKFTKFSDSGPNPDGTLGDGDSSKVDGACEVCHTATTYHNKNGTGASHYPANNCTACHPHFTDDVANYFAPTFVGGQSHFTHFNDPKGPMLGTNNCTYCHSTSGFHFFADGKPLFPETGYPQGTAVCDPCHSKNGLFDGVDDPVIGAKPNWEPAIYEAPTDPDDWPSQLKAGKEDWCAGCHDNGTSVVNSVSAPNVMGDNVAYGYNISGHGRNPSGYIKCEACHDLVTAHTDGNQRTYSAQANNYKEGYRLAKGLTIPKQNIIGSPAHYELCLDCHIYSDIMGPGSDFWNQDNVSVTRNLHNVHVGNYPISAIACWDSDWSCVPGTGTCSNAVDSAMSCTTCHNVHGSPMKIGSTLYPSPKMIRHGELISTPGTTNKVPALDFGWYDVFGNRTADFDQSVKGRLICGAPENLALNYVCWGCHTQGEVTYRRNLGVTVNSVWTSDTDVNSTPKDTFHPGEPIRYHVNFTITGANPTYYVTENGVAQRVDGLGQKQTFSQSSTLAPGTYETAVDKTIPVFIPPPGGLSVMVSITMSMYNTPGGLLIDDDLMSHLFRIE